MSDVEEWIRERAYILWEQAGCPHGRADDFWLAAEAELPAGTRADQAPVIELPPEAAAQPGVPTGMPGERIAEQGVMDERLADLAIPALAGGEH